MTDEAPKTTKLPATCRAMAKRLLKAGDMDLAVALFKKALSLDSVAATDMPRKTYAWLVQLKVAEDAAWKASGLAAG